MKATGSARVIWDKETDYQYARVVEERDGERTPRAQRGPGDPLGLPPGRVADRRLLGRDARPAVRGAGPARRDRSRSSATPPGRPRARTATSSRARASTRSRSTAALTDVGRRLFDLRGPNLHTYTADARPFLRRSTRRYDLIVVDAYRQPYIPFYLATREFFALAREHLTPRRDGRHQRRAPGALGPPREGAERDDGRRASRTVAARPERADEHDARRDRRAGVGGRDARGAGRLPAALRPVATGDRRTARAARCAGGASTPTTWRRSSG